MATLSKLTPGQVLYAVSRRKMGRTSMSTIDIDRVRVESVHENHVIASFNGKAGRQYGQRDVSSWRVNEPRTVLTAFGARRLARRDELAAQNKEA